MKQILQLQETNRLVWTHYKLNLSIVKVNQVIMKNVWDIMRLKSGTRFRFVSGLVKSLKTFKGIIQNWNGQKQPPRGVLRKRCFENMLQIYWRTPMLKSDFNKVARQLYWNHASAWVFSCKFAAYFQNTFA